MKKMLLSILPVCFLCVSAFPQVRNIGDMRMHTGAVVSLRGDFTNDGTFNNNVGTLHLNGTSLQNLNGNSVIQVFDLLMNNGGGVKLDNQLEITNTFNFTNGVLASDRVDLNTEFVHFLAGSSVTGTPNDASHIDGVVRKTGNTAFTFPIGNLGNYQWASIGAPSNITDHFTGFYVQQNPTTAGFSNASIAPGCINHVSACEYWIINRTGGTSAVPVTLTWDANSCGVTHMCELVVARWGAGQWNSEGNGGTTGTTTAGSVTSGTGCGTCGTPQAVVNFSPFTLASQTVNNPLPVQSLVFQAKAVENTWVDIEWQTLREINTRLFVVERSADAHNWLAISQREAAGNSDRPITYQVADKQPLQGKSYYRLRSISQNQSVSFSQIETVWIGETSRFALFPNPTTETLYIQYPAYLESPPQVQVFNNLGVKIPITAYQEGNSLLRLDVKGLANATYIIQILTENQIITEKFSKINP